MPAVAIKPAYIVFDIETIPDGELLKATKFAQLSADHPQVGTVEGAITAAKERMLRDSDGKSDFIPLPYHLPVCYAFALVDSNFRLLDVAGHVMATESLGKLTKGFWDLIAPCTAKLVSYNGRTFDLPAMELAAYRVGLSMPNYYKQKYGPRNRYGDGHVDLFEFFTNLGACRLYGGLDFCTKALGLPGKQDVSGKDVYDLYKSGNLATIRDYCAKDVLDTYRVFLRSRVMVGDLTASQESDIIKHTINFLGMKSLVYQLYAKSLANTKPSS